MCLIRPFEKEFESYKTSAFLVIESVNLGICNQIIPVTVKARIAYISGERDWCGLGIKYHDSASPFIQPGISKRLRQ